MRSLVRLLVWLEGRSAEVEFETTPGWVISAEIARPAVVHEPAQSSFHQR
jgi:hypothetical protein